MALIGVKQEKVMIFGGMSKARLKIANETFEQFCKRNKLDDVSPCNQCEACGRKLDYPSSFWNEKDTSCITWEHENCSNGGPAQFVYSGEKSKNITKIFDAYVEMEKNDKH